VHTGHNRAEAVVRRLLASHTASVVVVLRFSRRLGEVVACCSTLCYGRVVSKTIAQRELRNDNAKVIEAVAAGESFVVTRNGEPVAELRPIGRARRTFVPRAEVLSIAIQGPHIDGAGFRHDLDRVIDQGL
jgi:prevent-host-death family protein